MVPIVVQYNIMQYNIECQTAMLNTDLEQLYGGGALTFGHNMLSNVSTCYSDAFI